LLLLQKTMLVAEGVGRRLHPEANMWELARPLIEGWMQDGMGAEAQIMEAIDDLARGLERLPQLISEMEETVGSLASGGLRLHPDSVEALAASRGGGARWPLWAGAALAVALIAALS
jgi:ubiquinone biosynthesis protein